MMLCRGLIALKTAAFGGKLGYQDTAIPDYFTALREQDLEEMVEEEKVLLQDFHIKNMTHTNL